MPVSRWAATTQGDCSHRLVVQTPHVYPNKKELKLVVQCYDAYGNAHVSSAALSISASLGGHALDVGHHLRSEVWKSHREVQAVSQIPVVADVCCRVLCCWLLPLGRWPGGNHGYCQ